MRTIIASCALVVFSIGVMNAEEFGLSLTKVEIKDGKASITGKKKAKKGEEAKEFTYTVEKDAKVNQGKGKFDKDTKKFVVTVGDAIEGGLKSEMFKDISSDKPLNVYLTTSDKDIVTSIVVLAKKKATN